MKSFSKKHKSENCSQSSISSNPSKEITLEEGVTALKAFLNDTSHIFNFPSNDEILQRFLTLENLDIDRAIGRLENFCYIRGCNASGLTHHFQMNINPEVKYYLKSGFFVPIPEPDCSELLVYISIKSWDVNLLTIDQLLSNMCTDLDLICLNKKAQTHGVSLIVDLEGLSRKQAEILISKSYIKDLMRIWQEGFPLKNDKVVFLKESTLFELIFRVFKFWFKSLSLNRVYHIKQGGFDQLKQLWPDSENFLPTDLGGKSDSLAAFRKDWEIKIWNHLTHENPFADLKIDEALRDQKTGSVIRTYDEIPDDFFSLQGLTPDSL